MAKKPHLVEDGDLKRCSVCGCPFPKDAEPSVDKAFAIHLKAHRPGQTDEDVNQAAFRMVKEATGE